MANAGKSEIMEMTGVLITGGGGFLGSHLAEFYLNLGRSVICVDDFSTGLRANQTYLETCPGARVNLQFIEADVSRPWSRWLEKLRLRHRTISHVFHFASPASPAHYQRLPLETMWVNTVGLGEALHFADSSGARVVFASTSEVYGDPEVNPQSESYWGHVNTQGPRSCYDEAKRFGEALIYTHNRKYQTRHGLVRIFNTYGPRMNPNDGRAIVNLLVQALKKERLSIYGNGQQSRSFCYVDDLVAGIHRYAQSELSEAVNLGNATEHTLIELAKTVQKLFVGESLQLEFFDLPKDDPRRRCPDLTRALSALAPWHPQVSLEEGLKKMLEWLETQDLNAFEMSGRPK